MQISGFKYLLRNPYFPYTHPTENPKQFLLASLTEPSGSLLGTQPSISQVGGQQRGFLGPLRQCGTGRAALGQVKGWQSKASSEQGDVQTCFTEELMFLLDPEKWGGVLWGGQSMGGISGENNLCTAQKPQRAVAVFEISSLLLMLSKITQIQQLKTRMFISPGFCGTQEQFGWEILMSHWKALWELEVPLPRRCTHMAVRGKPQFLADLTRDLYFPPHRHQGSHTSSFLSYSFQKGIAGSSLKIRGIKLHFLKI